MNLRPDFQVRNALGVVLSTSDDLDLAKAKCRELIATHPTAKVYSFYQPEPVVTCVYSPRLRAVA